MGWGGVAFLGVLVALTAACGGSSQPLAQASPVPLVTSVTSASASPSSSPSLDPDSDAAVIAAVTSWARALTEMSNSGTLAPIERVATSSCVCVQGADQTVEYISAHHLRLNAHYSISGAHVVSRGPETAVVAATISTPAFTAMNPDGSIFQSEPANSITQRYSLRRQGGSWLVDAVF
jgi:hypothetical protein